MLSETFPVTCENLINIIWLKLRDNSLSVLSYHFAHKSLQKEIRRG